MNDIRLSSSVYQTIVTHALSHDQEEIMGYLFGEIGSCIKIYAALPFRRSTHLPDRVEIKDEDTMKCAEEASVCFFFKWAPIIHINALYILKDNFPTSLRL